MRYHLTTLPFLLISVFASALQAVTVHVPGEEPTIQAGIDACVDGDTVMVADGTYTVDGNRDIDFTGKAIVVISENGPDATIIDCESGYTDRYRGFIFQSGEDSSSVLHGFTITAGAAERGGAIYNEFSNPTITNCAFIDNWTFGVLNEGGAGVSNYYSSPTITNCRFEANRSHEGAGMYNDRSSPTVTDCTFEANVSDRGAAMYNDHSSPTVTNCTFEANLSAEGAGMYNYYSSPTVSNCMFIENSTQATYGGGEGMTNYYSDPTVTNSAFIRNQGIPGGHGSPPAPCGILNSYSNPTVTHCIFNENDMGGMGNSNNSSPVVTNCVFMENGGTGMQNLSGSSPTVTNCIFTGNPESGMYNTDSSPTVVNCIFSGNSMGPYYWYGGGGMSNIDSHPTITNCTFSGNSTKYDGGGLYNGNSDPIITNSIFWGDIPDEIYDDETSNSTVQYSDVQGGYRGEGNINADPLSVSSHGFDYLLHPASPCVDAGDPEIEDFIYDGHPRWPDWYPNGQRSDMGAYGGPENKGWLH